MKKSTTTILILATIFIWVAYDLYVAFTTGNAVTESATIWRFAWTLASVPFAFGILSGHLFLEQRDPSAVNVTEPMWKEVTEVIILALTLIWLGFDIYAYVKFGIACQLSQWIWEHTWHEPGIPLIIGAVIGSIFFQMYDATE